MSNGEQAIQEAIRSNIPRCFGERDKIFAGHASEKDVARFVLRYLLDAIDNGLNISFNDFLSMCEEYLRNENCTTDHVNKQLKRIRKIELYF